MDVEQLVTTIGVVVAVILLFAAMASAFILTIVWCATFTASRVSRAIAKVRCAYWAEVIKWSNRDPHDRHLPIQLDDACSAALRTFEATKGRPEDRMLAAVTAWGKYARRFVLRLHSIDSHDESSTAVTTPAWRRQGRPSSALQAGRAPTARPAPPPSAETDGLRPHPAQPPE